MSIGKGVVKHGVWVAQESDYTPLPATRSVVGKPGNLPSNTPTQATTFTIPLTGVFTATGKPTPTSGASSIRNKFRVQVGSYWFNR